MVKDVDWYDSERPLGEISLGGLIALVFIRTIQKNTIKTRVSSASFEWLEFRIDIFTRTV